jgi:hypothetical protein
MAIVYVPDMAVPLPQNRDAVPDLHERVTAAENTIHYLLDRGLDPTVTTPTPSSEKLAEEMFLAHVKDSTPPSTRKFSNTPPASLLQVRALLDEYGQSVVQSAVQIRNLVTNKLLQEAENPDGRIRIRALELLGKISDVGLFTERSEVTITARSTDELKQTLREKLEKLRAKPEIIDVEPEIVEPGAETPQKEEEPTNLAQELGLDDEIPPVWEDY